MPNDDVNAANTAGGIGQQVGTDNPGPASMPAGPPRPLDQIRSELQAAKVKRAAAQSELDIQGGIVTGLVREYRDAITWADQECKVVEADILGAAQGTAAWVQDAAQKIAAAI